MSSSGAARVLRTFRIVAAALVAALTACSSLTFLVANAPVPFGSFKRLNDIAYGTDARQHLDVFSPRSGTHPVAVFFYGGSWTSGQKSQYAFVGAALAAHGYVTVIPDYRLYPQVRFPEFLADAAQAVAWTRHHAHEFGGDPNQIILMGHSAGAHMAAMLALDPGYLTNAQVPMSSIVALIGLSGPYALVPDSDVLRAIFNTPYVPQDWQPVRFASKQAPPTLLLQGLDDAVVSPSHTRKMRDALQSYNVAVETHFYPKRGHADTIASFSLAARFRTPALHDTVAFLGRVTADQARDVRGATTSSPP
jgi:acetyl esterase/lipase